MPSVRKNDTVTPEALLARYSPDVQTIANALRQLVKVTIPEAQEQVKLGWQLVGYHVPDGTRSRYFCFVSPLADEVRLGFEYGVLLGDQAPLKGDGSQVRYVSIRTLDEIDPERLSSLVAEAAMIAIERGARASVR